MWPLLTTIAIACVLVVIIHRYWQRRVSDLGRSHQVEIARLEEQQRELADKSQAQQKALLNSMTEGLLVLDENDRIQASNRALHGLFNPPHSVTGRTMLEAFRLHPLEELAQRLKTEQQVLGFELEVPGPSPHFLQVNAAAILDDDNNRLGALLIFHDLTRLKQLESTRQEFVANVSHELRTPLSMIKGYAETLLNGAKNDPEVATRFLQIIERHADRLAFLIDDLLTISQLEGGEMVLNLDAVNLHGLVAAVFEDLRARAEKQHVLLHNSVPDGLRANADGERLKQVLWNLVENAIKYGGEDGQVRVSAETVNSDTLQVSVRDNGPGIPEEALLRVFERFYRVDKARSREAGGTGLGLSIVKHIVQRHGGKVWAESVLSEGSTFYFTLPSAPML